MPLQAVEDARLQDCLDRLAAGDPAAKNDLIAAAYAQFERRAHQMLTGFPAVRRSHDTGDVVQEACLRLVRSLEALHPENPRQLLGLAGLHIRRVLIDLYRHCRGPESYEANHATNVARQDDGELRHRVDDAPARPGDSDQSAWERLHAAAETLDSIDQELFHLRWFLGLTHAQIATQLGCSEKTVKRDWNRVKETLRQRAGDGTGL
jgi:RNA polymerase sigma factor (sigma-70 family)